MKIGYFSDIHTEFFTGIEGLREKFANILAEAYADADVIVAAGDIGTGIKAIKFLKLAFPSKPVIYVPGNHDHWTNEIHSTHRKMAAEAEGSNIHFFHDGGTIEIDGVMFCAATLWTDYALTDNQYNMQNAQERMTDFERIEIQPQNAYSVKVQDVMQNASTVMNDFYKIRIRHLNGRPYNKEIETRRLHPKDLLALHRAHVANIMKAMATALAQDIPLVVVSHHAPSARSLMFHSKPEDMETYFFQKEDPFYASHLDYLMQGEDAPTYWIHGHTHIAVRYQVGNTFVLSNPKGYSDGEDAGWDLGRTVVIPS